MRAGSLSADQDADPDADPGDCPADGAGDFPAAGWRVGEEGPLGGSGGDSDMVASVAQLGQYQTFA